LPAAGNSWSIPFTIEGNVPQSGGLNMAAMSLVESDPFEALGIRVLRGRVLTESDNAGTQLVAIVNRKMARALLAGPGPIGKRLRRGLPETSTPWMTVVGEVDDVKLGSPDAETMAQVYQPVTQTVASEGLHASVGELSAADGWIVLRTRMAPEQMEDTLHATVQQIDPQLPLYQMQTMEHAISKSEGPRRFNTVLISSFAIAAVLLSVLGIYAVDCVLSCIARTGNGGAHGAWRPALRSDPAHPEFRRQACGYWLWLGFAWGGCHIPFAAFLSV